MKLGIIGTGKIVHEALFAMEEITEIERTAIFARPHSREKGQALADALHYSLDNCKAVLQSAGIADTDGDGRMDEQLPAESPRIQKQQPAF